MTRRTRVTRARRRALPALLVVLAVAAAVLVAVMVIFAPRSRRAPVMESVFQDDQYLLYAPTGTVSATLDTLKSLGVDRVRIQVVWAVLAPGSLSVNAPPRFDATNPADYPAQAWFPYDRLVEFAAARGIGVEFDLTAPGPLWAMARPAPDARSAAHYRPSPRAFGRFVRAVGRRYSGSYSAPEVAGGLSRALPRVDYWSVWNEPNQPGWLAPQWRTVAGQRVMDSPRLYREYVNAAFGALEGTGHSSTRDTILIGELAPEGSESPGSNRLGCTQRSAVCAPIPPMSFLRALYCVDAGYRPLRGSLAGPLHCPGTGSPAKFVAANPGLFQATGFAHHPYSFFLPPATQMADPNFVPLADLSRLEQGLDRIFAVYGVHRQLPIYLTEYGYETNPPNPFRGVALGQQALYLNQAQYIASRDPRVRSLAQFLLYDSLPDKRYPRGTPGYWSTFQTGLRFANGAYKPSFNAYRLPIYVPQPVFSAGASVLIWGMLRLAPNNTVQHAQIQWRGARGAYRTLSTVTTSDRSGLLSVQLALPGTGAVRIAWTSPTGNVFHSRAAGVRQR